MRCPRHSGRQRLADVILTPLWARQAPLIATAVGYVRDSLASVGILLEIPADGNVPKTSANLRQACDLLDVTPMPGDQRAALRVMTSGAKLIVDLYVTGCESGVTGELATAINDTIVKIAQQGQWFEASKPPPRKWP